MNLGTLLSLLLCTFALQSCTAEPTPYDKPVEKVIPRAAKSSVSSVITSGSSKSTATDTAGLPKSALIDVPFSPQAPFGSWEMPYQEACEEMSLILVHRYILGQELTRQEADDELKKMVDWQLKNLGHYEDTTTDEVKTIAEKYYGHTASIVENPDIEDIKRQIAAGHPVIIPTSGRDLGNPYFSGAGPWYHMLVVIGYDEENFIVHDVGTKRGERYTYEQKHLWETIHDWTGIKEEIRTGKKVMLVVE